MCGCIHGCKLSVLRDVLVANAEVLSNVLIAVYVCVLSVHCQVGRPYHARHPSPTVSYIAV